MKKSALILFLIFTLLLTECFVFASEPANSPESVLTEVQQEKIEFLASLGIIDGTDLTGEAVTRGEFALWLSRLSGFDVNFSSGSKEYEDVPSSNKYSDAVNMVTSLGYMNGISEAEFGVNNTMDIFNAQVALVRMLGYDRAVMDNGGYPDGYSKYSALLRLDKDCAGIENQRTAILLRCYNALFASHMTIDGYVFNDALFINKRHSIYMDEGRVTATRFTSLGTESITLQNDEIEIDNKAYKTENIAYTDYLGEYVNYYYRLDEKTDTREIVYLTPLKGEGEKLVIFYKDILDTSTNTVYYDNGSGKTKKAELRPGYDFVLNNRVDIGRVTSDLKITDGILTLIDAEGDGLFELAKAERIETMVYQGADNFEDIIYCKEGNLYTDPFDNDYYCLIYKVDERDGSKKEITIDEMTAGDVLTVYRSEDNKYMRIYAYSSGVYGVVEKISDKTVTIDGVEYDLPLKTPAGELNIGADSSFSVDMFGRLVYLDSDKKSSGPHYGYLFAYAGPKGLGQAQVKILDGDKKLIFKLAEKIKVDDTSEYSGDGIRSCGSLFNAGALKRQLIKYCTDARGDITKLYTSSGTAGESIKKDTAISKDALTPYYHWRDIWGDGKFKKTSDTFYIVIPDADELTYPGEKDDEALYGTYYNYGPDTNNVNCEVYDVDAETKEAGAILVYDKKTREGMAATDSNTAVGVFVKCTEGMEGGIVHLWHDGSVKQYNVNPDNLSMADLKNNYSFGDAVRYITNSDGVITTLVTAMDMGARENDLHDVMPGKADKETYDQHYFGRVVSKNDGYIIIAPNRNGDGTGTGNTSYDTVNTVIAPTSDIRNCAVVDMVTKQVIGGTADSVAKYFGNGGIEGGCYVYTRIYKFSTLFDLIIYKF